MTHHILVTREADEFSRILTAGNYEIINLPLIETKSLDDLSDFQKKLAAIENYDGIFLTSAPAAKILVGKMLEKNVNFRGKVYVFGKRSFDILKNVSLEIFYDETANTAREFLKKIAPEELKNKRFIYVCGKKSLRVVPKFLKNVAEVEETIVYETLEVPVSIDKIKELRERFAQDEITAICFFSPSQAESFIRKFGAEILNQTLVATIGKTTARFLERQKLTVNFVSSKATAEDFAVELVSYLNNYAHESHERFET